jgi:hypothetical protein
MTPPPITRRERTAWDVLYNYLEGADDLSVEELQAVDVLLDFFLRGGA